MKSLGRSIVWSLLKMRERYPHIVCKGALQHSPMILTILRRSVVIWAVICTTTDWKETEVWFVRAFLKQSVYLQTSTPSCCIYCMIKGFPHSWNPIRTTKSHYWKVFEKGCLILAQHLSTLWYPLKLKWWLVRKWEKSMTAKTWSKERNLGD